jgi:sugar phosphate isomerase/epimerase
VVAIRLCAVLPFAETTEVLALAGRLGLWGVGLPLPRGGTADAVRQGVRLRDAGVRIVQFSAPHNLAAPDPAARERAVAGLRAAMDVAAAAGAAAVVTEAGHADPARGAEARVAHPDNLSQAALDRVADTCRQVLDGAPGGVRLLVEPSVLSPVGNLLRAAEAVRRVAHPAFGIAFDPVQLTTLDNFFDNGSYLRRAVQQLGTAVGAVHARDVLLHPDGFSYRLAEEPVGRGGLDYPALLDALAHLDPDVPLCVEQGGGAPEIEAALGYLRRVAAAQGIALED